MELNEKLLTLRQAAERLGLTVSCLRAWKERRKIGFVRIGRTIRVPESELRRLISENMYPARERSHEQL